MEKVVKLFGSDDPHAGELAKELRNVIYKRGVGIMTLSTVIGVLRIVEHEIITEAKQG